MFRKSTRANALGDVQGPDQKTMVRGLGPFTGGQLTAIVVTFAVLLLFPVGAWALSFTNVSIIDPGGVNRAKVNASGQLSTTAFVTGSVTATQVTPGAMFTYATSNFVGPGADFQVLPPPPAGKARVVTSITMGSEAPVTSFLYLALDTAGSGGTQCTTTNPKLVGNVTLNPGLQAITVPYPTGLTIGPNRQLCIVSSTNLTSDSDYTINGYYVPAAQCQSPNVCN